MKPVYMLYVALLFAVFAFICDTAYAIHWVGRMLSGR